MAAPPTANVYMEAMEGAKGSNQKPPKAGRTGVQSLQMGICEGLLASGRKSGFNKLHNKQETRTGGI